ncbi:MAG: hypothetical protein KC502_03365 [Myxococcales bacterium]|nr:hypothetical protein [Myxococcales bacterium]
MVRAEPDPPKWGQDNAEPWIQALLPMPVERIAAAGGSVLLVGGDPGLVALRLNSAAVRVGLYAQKWWGAKPVLVDETLVALPWARLPDDLGAAKIMMQHLIDAAIVARKARFFTCERCELPRPPEWLHANRLGPKPCQMCGFDTP